LDDSFPAIWRGSFDCNGSTTDAGLGLQSSASRRQSSCLRDR